MVLEVSPNSNNSIFHNFSTVLFGFLIESVEFSGLAQVGNDRFCSIFSSELVHQILNFLSFFLDLHALHLVVFGVFLRRMAAVLNSALLCSTVNGPPTAFPVIGPHCTVGVLTGTHWGAH